MLKDDCECRCARPHPDAADHSSLIDVARMFCLGGVLLLCGCGGLATRDSPSSVTRAPDSASDAPPPPRPSTRRGGGYYLDDGPGDNPPPNLERVPDAVPRAEPLHRGTMRPYLVMGQSYTPMTALQPYKARGIASWYGRRYHGRQTSSGEIYDMYAMTAAHTVLPIPSYARITNVANNKSVIVRINDRGPFHSDRLVDLSYTAALKLGVLGGGRALVEVETILPDAGTPAAVYAQARQAPSSRPAVTTAPAPSAAPPPDAVIGTPLPVESAAVSADVASLAAGRPAAPPVVPLSAEIQGIFLQLGAFGSHDNAANYLARLRSQVEWLAPTLQVYPKEGLFRVHAGPYASEAHARAAADRISEALGLKPIVLSR